MSEWKDSRVKDWSDIDEKSPILNMPVYAFELDSGEILLRYLRYEESI